jgi:hypothetical protein
MAIFIASCTMAVRLFTAEFDGIFYLEHKTSQNDVRHYRAADNHLEHSCNEWSGRHDDRLEI